MSKIDQGIKLRDITAQDLPSVFKGLSDSLVIRHYGVSFKTLEKTQKQMQFYEDLVKNNTGKWWAVCSNVDGSFLGATGFNNVSAIHRRAEIGYWLMPTFWGRGIAAKAVRLACEFGFKQMNLHRIEAWIEEGNTASEKLVNKLGFTNEAVFRDYEIKNGAFITLKVYALLKSNFNIM